MSRPTVQEIAALTARLRELSNAGREVDAAEVERFLAEKRDLIDRITADDRRSATRGRDAAFAGSAAEDALRDVVRARAETGGYLLVGPSARTWRADPAGRPVEPAPEAEHRAVRELLGREQLDATEPEWTTTADGRTDIVCTVIPAADADGAAWLDDPLAAGPDPWADYRTYTPTEAAAELVARGVPPDQAPGIVDRYIDSLTYDRGWSPQDQWEIDDDDLAAMTDPATRDAADVAPPSDNEADAPHRRDAAAREQPGEDGLAQESCDVADGPSAAADAYSSHDGPGYDWWAWQTDAGAGAIPSASTLSGEAAARTLAADGWPPDQAWAEVARYLDDVSAQLGTSAHAWGLDEADLDAIRAADAGRIADAVLHAHQAVISVEPATDVPAAGFADEQPPEADMDVFE